MKKLYLIIILIFTNCFPVLERSSLELLTFLQVFSPKAIQSNSILFQVSGLSSGNLVLNLNTSQEITLSSNGEISIEITVPIGSNFSLSIMSQPRLHTCAMDISSGTVNSQVTNINVNCFSLIKQSPPNLGILLPTDKVRLQFSDTLDLTTSCNFTNATLDLVAGSPTFTLETTLVNNDTYVVDPSPSTWNTGVGKSIDGVCQSATGKPMPAGGFTLSFIIPDTFRYVADITGNDLNDGLTPSTPFRSINKSILDMTTCSAPNICVALVEEGSYDPTSQGQNLIIIEDRISIVGGYKRDSNYSINDFSLYPTIVNMTSPPASCAASNLASPCATIAVPNTVTAATSIVGLQIIAGDVSTLTTNLSVGIAISGASANILYNNITAGTSTLGDSVGMLINNFGTNINLDPTGGIVRYNTIRGGTCLSANCRTSGIFLTATIAGKYPFIANNQVHGGSCSANSCSSYGLFSPIAMPITFLNSVIGNSFTGGTITTGILTESTGMYLNNNLNGELTLNVLTGGSAVISKGLHLNSSMPLIIGNSSGDGNGIVGGSASSQSYGVYLASGGTLNFNTIYGGPVDSTGSSGSYGIYSQSGSLFINDNIISGGGSTANGTATLAGAYGIYSDNTGLSSSFLRNNISAGLANHKSLGDAITKGFFTDQGNSLTIINNLIDGGASIVDIPSQNANSIGLEISRNTSADKIYNNTISSGQAKDNSSSLTITDIISASKDIRYNIFGNDNSLGTRSCIKHEGGGFFNNLSYNNFYNCPIFLDYNPSAAQYDTICTGGNLGQIGNSCATPLAGANFSNNLSVNPNFVNEFGFDRDWNFTSSSPCSLTQMPDPGLVPNDFLLNPRPGSNTTISAGAIEYDGSCL